MKSIRNIKLRTFCPDPIDLALARSRNPLKQYVPVVPSPQTTDEFLAQYKIPVDPSLAERKPYALHILYFYCMCLISEYPRIFYDKNPPGWLVWNNSVALFMLPHASESTFLWESASEDAIQAIREITTGSKYWENLSTYYSEENHETTIIQDNVSCVKSICEGLVIYLLILANICRC
jgi:proteasome activator subunit 4